MIDYKSRAYEAITSYGRECYKAALKDFYICCKGNLDKYACVPIEDIEDIYKELSNEE